MEARNGRMQATMVEEMCVRNVMTGKPLQE